jgi:arsenite methyltransferase
MASSALKSQLDTPALAETYSVMNRKGNYQNASGLKLVQMLGIREGQTVVDLGCGTGELTRHIAIVVGKHGRVVGIDPSADRIEKARSLLRNATDDLPSRDVAVPVDYLVGAAEDVEEILLGSGQSHDVGNGFRADVVIMNSVFHWVEDKNKTLRGVLSILTQDGQLGISGGLSDLWSPMDVRKTALSRLPFSEHPIEGLAHYVSSAEMVELLRSTGFQRHHRELVERERTFESVEAFVRFCEASTSGQFLYVDYLPEELRVPAREAIMNECVSLKQGDGPEVVIMATLAIWVASKG